MSSSDKIATESESELGGAGRTNGWSRSSALVDVVGMMTSVVARGHRRCVGVRRHDRFVDAQGSAASRADHFSGHVRSISSPAAWQPACSPAPVRVTGRKCPRFAGPSIPVYGFERC